MEWSQGQNVKSSQISQPKNTISDDDETYSKYGKRRIDYLSTYKTNILAISVRKEVYQK